MEYRRIGRSGLKASVIGLGCNNFGRRIDNKASRLVVHKALDLGITFFDTSDSYGIGGGLSEQYLGRSLGARRKDVVLATKFCNPMGEGPYATGASRRYVFRAVEASLKRLGTDWIDLYQLHRPDPQTPIEETLEALSDLVQAGKVRYIGCSNFAAWQLVDADWTARSRNLAAFISVQNRYSLLDRDLEREVAPAAVQHGIGVLPFSPLEDGFLTGKYKRGKRPTKGTRLAVWDAVREAVLTEANFDKLGILEDFAGERGHSLVDLAFGWLASQPHVSSVIAGATKPSQVKKNVAAGDWRLSSGDLEELDARLAVG
jgi:aryl-alcohol dehydrogenase-like predicted oxidoreductase